MTRQAALPRHQAAGLSLIEEILLEWVLSGETLPRSPRRRPSCPLLERPRVATLIADRANPDLMMPLPLAA